MPEQTPSHPYTKYIGVAMLVVTIGIVLVFSFFQWKSQPAPQPTVGESIRLGTAARPSVTASTTIKELAKTKGFSALVSYTDDGFEPKAITVKSGQTIRFTNNSSRPLQISIDSTLSPTLAPQSFWEFTLSKKGELKYTNALDPNLTGDVSVE